MTRIKTEIGEIEVRTSYYGSDSFEIGNVSVSIDAPDVDDPDALQEDINIKTDREYLTASEALDYAKLVEWAAAVTAAIEKGNKPYVKLAEKKREEEEREEERKREEREAVLSERKERLLTEFMGETVKIRERGYKTARIAVVEAVQRERYDYDKREYVKDEEWTLKFRYKGEQRTQSVPQMKRLDIKVGSEWQTLWDDGTDDVWGELATSAKPTGKMYDQMSERI